jgi:hypothetical protein
MPRASRDPERLQSGELVNMIEAEIAGRFERQYAKLSTDEVTVLAVLRPIYPNWNQRPPPALLVAINNSSRGVI